MTLSNYTFITSEFPCVEILPQFLFLIFLIFFLTSVFKFRVLKKIFEGKIKGKKVQEGQIYDVV